MTRPGVGAVPGAPRERTALSWFRTAASLAVVSVGGARLLAERTGPPALVLALVGLGLSFAVAVVGRVRYARPDAAAPAGVPLGVTAAAAFLLGVVGLALVLALARG